MQDAPQFSSTLVANLPRVEVLENTSQLNDALVETMLAQASEHIANHDRIFVYVNTAEGPHASWDVEVFPPDDVFAESSANVTIEIPASTDEGFIVISRNGSVLHFEDVEEAAVFLMMEALHVADLSLWSDPPVNIRDEAEARALDAFKRWRERDDS